MTKRTVLVAAALLGLAAACGDGGASEPEASADDEAASTPSKNIAVRVVADQSGLSGCSEATGRSGLDVARGSRLTVTDADGATVGTGTFDLSPGLEFGVDICDWTAVASEVEMSSDFYTLDAGGEMATLSSDELASAGWSLELRIAVDGSVDYVGG